MNKSKGYEKTVACAIVSVFILGALIPAVSSSSYLANSPLEIVKQ